VFKFKFKFLLIFLTVVLICIGYLGWEKWLATSPQPLPERSTVTENSLSLPGRYAEISLPPTGPGKYRSADYRLWIPEGSTPLRGLIVKQHGCSDQAATTGLDHANDLQWQALASKHRFALLGARYLTGDQSCDEWATLSGGSEAAFLKAVQLFSQQTQHPELTQVPWALWGHSGGADWAVQMLQKYPDRTLAVVAARCGASTFPDTVPAGLGGVPLLFATAGKENMLVAECRDLPKRVFQQQRKLGALWALAEEANAPHGAGTTRPLAISYLDALITARLPETGTKLRSLDSAPAWLGNPSTRTIAPVKQYLGNPLEAAWLPNEATARKWQEYVTSGKISPTQPPKAPTAVKMVTTGTSEGVLTWNYSPDLENGLPLFRIYRNNTLIKTLHGQQPNYGDAPTPLQVALEFKDTKRPENASYSIAAFNSFGESHSQ
jgi:pimeloyl-ACP methyl ester carboxylesterase